MFLGKHFLSHWELFSLMGGGSLSTWVHVVQQLLFVACTTYAAYFPAAFAMRCHCNHRIPL
jgi:hypothetical protein